MQEPKDPRTAGRVAAVVLIVMLTLTAGMVWMA